MIILEFIRFATVGTLGLVLNLTVFTFVVKYLELGYSLGSIIAFCFAVTQNYTLNRAWTFRIQGSQKIAPLLGWGKYVGVNLLGLCINLIVLNVVLIWFGSSYSFFGQLLGIITGTVFNFLLSRLWVFQGYSSATLL